MKSAHAPLMISGVLLVLTVAVGVAGSRSQLTMAEKCAAAKLRATSRKVAAEIECYSHAVRKDAAVHPDCLSKAETKFEAAFAKAEGKGGCVTIRDDIVTGSAAAAFVNGVVRSLTSYSQLASCMRRAQGCGSCGAGFCTTDCEAGPTSIPFCVNLNIITSQPQPCDSDADCIAVAPATPYCVAAFGYPNSCSSGTFCAALCP